MEDDQPLDAALLLQEPSVFDVVYRFFQDEPRHFLIDLSLPLPDSPSSLGFTFALILLDVWKDIHLFQKQRSSFSPLTALLRARALHRLLFLPNADLHPSHSLSLAQVLEILTGSTQTLSQTERQVEEQPNTDDPFRILSSLPRASDTNSISPLPPELFDRHFNNCTQCVDSLLLPFLQSHMPLDLQSSIFSALHGCLFFKVIALRSDEIRPHNPHFCLRVQSSCDSKTTSCGKPSASNLYNWKHQAPLSLFVKGPDDSITVELIDKASNQPLGQTKLSISDFEDEIPQERWCDLAVFSQETIDLIEKKREEDELRESQEAAEREKGEEVLSETDIELLREMVSSSGESSDSDPDYDSSYLLSKQTLDRVLLAIIFSRHPRPQMNITDDDFFDPLHLATSNGRTDVLSKLLTDQQMDVNARDEESRRTALHTAVIKQHCSVVDLLLEHGADPNAVDNSGQTPLHLASMFAPHLVHRLIEAGSSPNVKDLNGLCQSPLHLSVIYDNLEALERLLLSGADPNIQSLVGLETALHIAVQNSNIQAIRLLVDFGASPYLYNANQISAVGLARSRLPFSADLVSALLSKSSPS